LKLPNWQNAVVDPAKVRDYLLSTSHPVGRFKAAFFNALGYTDTNWTVLHRDLLALAALDAAVPGQPAEFGAKYEVHATLVGPSGRTATVVTAWIVRAGEDVPRFITAYPG
jgi:hypothetical protein